MAYLSNYMKKKHDEETQSSSSGQWMSNYMRSTNGGIKIAQKEEDNSNSLQEKDEVSAEATEPKTVAGSRFTRDDILKAAADTQGTMLDQLGLAQGPTIRQQQEADVREFESGKTDAELFSAYADPNLKLNYTQNQSAKDLVKAFEAKYPKAQSFDPINGMDQEAAYQYAAMMNDPQYQEYLQLKNKVDDFSAFTTGLAEGTGAAQAINFLGRIGADDEAKAQMDEWKDQRNAVTQAGAVQNPVAYGAGFLGGKMAEYAAGRDLMRAIPGVNSGLQRFGSAVNSALDNGTKIGSAVATLLPADRIAGIVGDQILDTLFDTTPQVLEDLQRMDRQQREGVAEGEEEITGGGIALDAVKNFGANIGYNLLGELPGMIGDARYVPDAIRAQETLNALDEGVLPTARQAEAYNRYAARNGLEGSEDWYNINMSQRQDPFLAPEMQTDGTITLRSVDSPANDLYIRDTENGVSFGSRAADDAVRQQEQAALDAQKAAEDARQAAQREQVQSALDRMNSTDPYTLGQSDMDTVLRAVQNREVTDEIVGKFLSKSNPNWREMRDAFQQRTGIELPYTENGIRNALRRADLSGVKSDLDLLIENYQNGKLSNEQIRMLRPGSPYRQAFMQETGLVLPSSSGELRRQLRNGTLQVNEFAGTVDDPVYKEFFEQQFNQMDNVPAPGYNNVGGTQPDLSTLDVNTASWDEINSTRQIIQARENAAFDTPTVDINTPEREQLRQQIADDLMQLGSYSGKDADGNELFGGPVRRERRADIVIGPPAAGKSSVLANPLSEKYGSRIIDSDMAKARLPEFNGGLGASMVHEESAKITEDAVLSQSIYNGDNIVIPWVGKSPQKLRDALSVLKQSGYTVHLSLNELDPDKAARRAVSRFVSTGRFVDPNYVLSVGWKPSEVYELLKQEGGFDSYVKYSNDVPYGSPAKLIERIGQEPVQDGRMGGYGGGLRSFGNEASVETFAGRGQSASASGSVSASISQGTQSDAIPLRADGSASVSAPVSSNTPPAAPASGTNNPQIPDGMKERGYAESLRTKSNLPEDVKQDFVDNPEVYKQLSNADTFARAEAIFAEGSETAMNQFNRMLETKDAAAIPLGKMLADDLIANGNREAGVDVLRRMAASLTASGQFSQAAAITLLKNDPMTALQYITRQIDSLNANGLEKFGKKWKDFSLTKEEIDAFGKITPGDSDGLKKLFEQIGDRVAKEYPASVKEKLVEATHIAMLLNPRTMIRNLSSNLIFRPLEKISNKVSALGQNMYRLINSDFTPTQALFIDKESRNLASQVYDSVKEKITGVDKWENSILSGTKKKTVFKGNAVNRNLGNFGGKLREALNKASSKMTGEQLFDAIDGEKSILENLRQLTYGLLELGDRGFVKSNFTDRLASYIAAQGIKSIDDVPPEAIDTAMNAALKATFKDQNNLTNLFSAIRKNTGVLGETVFPFTTTPANVTMRSWDYTLGGAVNAIRAAKSGKEAGEIFDLLSKTVTGTGVALLGAGLYYAGILSGPASENKREAQFQKQQGFLPFALKIGDNYYSISWAAPASIPLVIGATFASKSEEGGALDADSILKSIKNAFASYIDTMLEQSTFQNLQDLVSAYGSTGENVIDTVAELPLRFIPSASGAAARAIDPVQRVTYSSDSILDTLYNNALAKIPGASKTLPAAYDTWGNEIRKSDSIGEAAFAQFINPGEIGNKAVTPLDSYIQTLFDETGDTALYPKKVDWSITVNDGSGPEDLKLTNDQYSAYQREVGSTSYDIAEQLFPMLQDAALPTSSQTYAVKEVYSIADELAKNTLFGDTISTADQNFLDKAESYGEGAQGIAELLFAKAVMHDVEGEKYPNGKTISGSVKRNKIQALVDAGYSRSEATRIYELLN